MNQIIGASVLHGDMQERVVVETVNLGLPVYLEGLRYRGQNLGASLLCVPNRTPHIRLLREVVLRAVIALDLLKIYDSGPSSSDRYTVVYLNEPVQPGQFAGRAMDSDPFHPMGYGGSIEISGDSGVLACMGRRIGFSSLPDPCQALVFQDLVTTKVVPNLLDSFVTYAT